MIYTALALIWVIYISFINSIISLTYRCVVEMIDEVTGFTIPAMVSYGFFLLLRIRSA